MSILNNTTDERLYPAGPLQRPPTHPGAVIRTAIEHVAGKPSIRDVATAIGVSHVALNDVVNEKAAVTDEMDLRISAYFGKPSGNYRQMQINRDLWLAEQRLAPELAKIKKAEAA